MTTTTATTATTESTGNTRNHARAAGIFYLITFAASLPAFALISAAINQDRTMIPGHHTQLLTAGLLDFTNALACVASAVALFPVLKRHHEAMALGLVTSRLIEAAIIMTGVVSLLAVATTGDNPSLIAVRDQTFLLGPGFMPAFNAVLLGTVLYRARLVPRLIPTLGLVGAPLLLAANAATLYGHNDQSSALSLLATVPIAAWELSLGLWLTIKGFTK